MIPKRTIKTTITMLLCLMATAVLFVVASIANPISVFEDQGLEMVVREKLSRKSGPIFLTDLRKIIELDASDRSIKSLEGLQHFSKLVHLDLRNNEIISLAPIGKLPMLQTLLLCNNPISDENLAFLEQAGLPGLRTLRLRDERHELFRDDPPISLAFIGYLHSLETLDLRGRTVYDASALRSLSSLVWLNLRETSVSNVDFLDHMPDLIYLNLHSNCEIESVEPIAQLTELEILIMRDVFIGEHVSLLEELTRMRRLNVRNTGISSIDFVEGMPDLAELNIGDNPIMEVSALASCTRLTELDMRSVPVFDHSLFDSLINLTHLNVYATQIKSIEFIRSMPRLHTLDVGSNPILDGWNRLSDHDFEMLGVAYIPIFHYDRYLVQQHAIKRLDVRGTGLASLELILGMEELIELSIADNPMEDVSAISLLDRLQTLDIRRIGQNTDLSIIETLPVLERLRADHTANLEDLAHFARIDSLAVLELSHLSVPSDHIADLFKDHTKPIAVKTEQGWYVP